MKKIIKIGCCGFPVEREKYYKEFDCVEINITFYQLPKIETAKKWLQESLGHKRNFEFIIKSWQIITHPNNSFTYRRLKEKFGDKKNYGFFQPTEEVFTAWKRTKEFAVELGCKKILFQCPAKFTPEKKNLSNLYNFFEKIQPEIKKHNFSCILEVRGEKWTEEIITKVCKDLALIHCTDPLYNKAYYGNYRYYRLHGLHTGKRLDYNYQYKDEELKKILSCCDQNINYVMFNNLAMYKDALRFSKII